MKIKRILAYIIIIILFIVLPSVVFLWENIAFWPLNNFIFAQNINKNLLKIFPNNNNLLLKSWDYNYRLGNYDKALENYLKINCGYLKDCFILYHNTANSYYKLWEIQKDTTKKTILWINSLSFYQKALDIKNDKETKYNYDFVLKKLKDLTNPNQEQEKKQPEEEKQQQEQDNEQEEKNKQEGKEDKGIDWQQQEQEDQIQPKWDSFKIDKNALNQWDELSQEEKEILKWYIQKLKQEEKQNIKLNKEWQIFNDDLNDFFNNPLDFDDFKDKWSWW